MYARLLALCCLLYVSTSAGRAESASAAGSELEVYLRGDAGSSSVVLGEMTRELDSLMQQAGFRISWRRANDVSSPGGAANLIVVDLRGACTVAAADEPAQPLPATLVLASSSVVDGRVLPFSWVDCSALNQFLGPVLANQPDAEQASIYGRSMARLLAHEFYHVLAQTNDHTQTGIAKARFSTADLLAEHFEFEPVALDRLRPPAPGSSADDASVSGR
jgi:hypothetical protein